LSLHRVVLSFPSKGSTRLRIFENPPRRGARP
jgi:hypothetical protein